MVSRRATRTSCEEQKVTETSVAGFESWAVSEDEMTQDIGGGRTRSSSLTIDIRMFPVVDIGKDLSNAFPKTPEDMRQQVRGCLQVARGVPKERVDNKPIGFGEVIPGRIYRSSFPIEGDFQYLQTLGLKTVISLVNKDFSPEFRGFIKDNGISHRVIDMQGTKKVAIPEHMMKGIMEIVLDKDNYPILIHCNQGKHRTGCTVGVIRHVAGWNVNEILEEYRGYAEPKIRDCDITYLSEYQVSTLRHLFVRHEIHSSQPILLGVKMAQFLILTAIVLAIWLTTIFL